MGTPLAADYFECTRNGERMIYIEWRQSRRRMEIVRGRSLPWDEGYLLSDHEGDRGEWNHLLSRVWRGRLRE